MLVSKTIDKYVCDRCKTEINYNLFLSMPCKRKIKISFSQQEFIKEGYFLPDSVIPLPDEECVEMEAIIGFKPKFSTVHLCTKCARQFRKFMKNRG